MLSKPAPVRPEFTDRLRASPVIRALAAQSGGGRACGLLPDQAQVGRHHFPVAAKRVDVQAAAAGVAGVDG